MVWIGCALALLLGCSLQAEATAPFSATPRYGESISGVVFRDLNGDGVRDPREQGEPGISVSAYDAGNRLLTMTTTDYAGSYVLRAQPNDAQINPGQGFFLFGDVDGSGEAVRLQRPGGLVHHEGVVYVADSYNNKIKTLNPQTGEVRTLLGTGRGAGGMAGSRSLPNPTAWMRPATGSTWPIPTTM